ncbi:MAG: beta-ketoacyl synthase chain length factor [Treponema sp.]|nr:beta-ketoacyl synthase chain length factor [Treponema sp.]
MKHNGIYISRFSAWAPGLENANEWEEWALGKREINICSESPALSFTEPMFRRRLSQISKMTIQVVHDLLPVAEETKMLFLSFRGELTHQYKINKTFIEDNDIMPAGFSLSVFNAPAALASMAFSLKGGYTAIYPGGNSFGAGLSLAEAAFLSRGETRGCGESEELIFVYADEVIPHEYKDIFPGTHLPLAFGFVLACKPDSLSIPFSALKEGINNPVDFLKRLILSKLN